MNNQLVMLLAGVFSLIAVINILVPDYYKYVLRMSKAIPEKQPFDILFKIIMVLEVCYILLGFTSTIPLMFLLLLSYEVIIAMFMNISKFYVFMIYEFVFLVINLMIFLWLFLS